MAWCGVAVTAALVWAGCSVEKHYDLLSFFFDGVPNPHALPILASSGDPAAIRLSKTYTAHEPFVKQDCSACHGARFDMKAVEANVCSKCHEGAQDAYPFMHGPVALGACLWCHAAHESAYPALLKSDARTVCVQCHVPALLSTDRVPQHADKSVSCLECHVGHGSDARWLLKAGWSSGVGTTDRGPGG